MKSIFLGRITGIPLFFNPTTLILPAWMIYSFWSEGWLAIGFGLCVLVSVLTCVVLHELGHCLMARYFGIRARDITLYAIGGIARLESIGKTPWEELCVALAGPAVNFGLLLVLGPLLLLVHFGSVLEPLQVAIVYLLGSPELYAEVVHWLLQYLALLCLANLFLLGLNLLPAFPMDGGRVLRALLSLRMRRLRATELAVFVGIFVALGMAVGGVVFGHLILVAVAVFVCIAGRMELNDLRRMESYVRRVPFYITSERIGTRKEPST